MLIIAVVVLVLALTVIGVACMIWETNREFKKAPKISYEEWVEQRVAEAAEELKKTPKALHREWKENRK